MPMRIWIVLVAALLLAAPASDELRADRAVEGPIAFDEAVAADTVAAPLAHPPVIAHAVVCDDATPPVPAPSRIFRPPREALG